MISIAEEKNFETRVKRFLADNGCWYVKYWAGSTFTKSGVPDILACIGGRFVGIEVKASNGKPTELQRWNLERIDHSGGYGVLLYPQDMILFEQFVFALLATDTNKANRTYLEIKERNINK